MAKVKLKQNGKVILKNGKVSCSCCEAGECCMYPAQALQDGLYTVDDLPDAVTLNYDLVQNFELTRSGSEFIGVFDQTVTYKVLLGTLPENEEYQWLLYVNDQLDDNYRCLILGDGNLNPSNDIIEDRFADTYTVASCSYAPVIGASVTRVSLCVWQGTYLDPENPFADGPQNVYLIYCPGTFIGCGSGEIFENGSGVEVPYFYAAIDIGGSGGFFAKKTPNANIPSGSYAGEFSISFS